MNRSLRTDSPSIAIRLSRKVSFEVEAIFEEKRREIGLPFDERLIVSPNVAATVSATMAPRSAASPPMVHSQTVEVGAEAKSALTLSDIYDRYLKDLKRPGFSGGDFI